MSLYSRRGSRGGRGTTSAAPPHAVASADLARDGSVLRGGPWAAMHADGAVLGGAGRDVGGRYFRRFRTWRWISYVR